MASIGCKHELGLVGVNLIARGPDYADGGVAFPQGEVRDRAQHIPVRTDMRSRQQ